MGGDYHHTVLTKATPSRDFTKWCEPGHTSGMDVQKLRRAALKAYIAKHFPRDGDPRGNVSAFAQTVDKAQSQIADMLDGRKSFGEKVAATLAKQLELAGYPAPDFGPTSPADRGASSRVSEVATTRLHGLSDEAISLAKTWQKLAEPIRTQIRALVETLGGAPPRGDRRAQSKGPKSPSSTRPNA